MATLLITHLGAGSDNVQDTEGVIRLNEFSVDLLFGSPRTITDVPAATLTSLVSLQRNQAAAKISVGVTYTADEVNSGLHLQSNSVESQDIALVPAATFLSAGMLMRVPLAAGAGGAPDDIPVVAVGALSTNLRILDFWADITTAVGASTVTLEDEAAAAGATLGSVVSAAVAVVRSTIIDGLAVVGATKGLILRRSDSGVAGTFYALLRPES